MAKCKGSPYSEPFRAVHHFFLRPLVLQFNSREEGVPPVVVGRRIFAEEEEVGGQTVGLEGVEPREEIYRGLGKADTEKGADGVGGHKKSGSHDPEKGRSVNTAEHDKMVQTYGCR